MSDERDEFPHPRRTPEACMEMCERCCWREMGRVKPNRNAEDVHNAAVSMYMEWLQYCDEHGDDNFGVLMAAKIACKGEVRKGQNAAKRSSYESVYGSVVEGMYAGDKAESDGIMLSAMSMPSQLGHYFDQLPDATRKHLEHYFFVTGDVRETASSFGVSPQRVSEGISRLRRVLADDGIELPTMFKTNSGVGARKTDLRSVYGVSMSGAREIADNVDNDDDVHTSLATSIKRSFARNTAWP